MKTFKNLGHGIIRLLLCSLLLASAAAYNSNKGVARRMVGSASPKGSKSSGGGSSGPSLLVHPGCPGRCLTIKEATRARDRALGNGGSYEVTFEVCENHPDFFWVHLPCGDDSGEYFRLQNVGTHECISRPDEECDQDDCCGGDDPVVELVNCHTPEAAIISDFSDPNKPDQANFFDASCWLDSQEDIALTSSCTGSSVTWSVEPEGQEGNFWLKKPANQCLPEIFYESSGSF